MRLAVSTGLLAIPPTYFVVEHARHLPESAPEVFALAGNVTDDVGLPVTLGAVGPLTNAFVLRNLAVAQRRLSRALRFFGPDVIHHHFATWSGVAASVSRSRGVPLVVTLHGYDVFPFAGPLAPFHRRSRRRTQARAARFLAVSEYLAGRAVEQGFDSRRLQVHYQGVDTDFFAPLTAADSRGISGAERPTGTGLRDLAESGAAPFGGDIAGRGGRASSAELSDGRLREEVPSRGTDADGVGVPAASFTSPSSVSEPRIEREVPRIVVVGALEPRKGARDVVAASLRVPIVHELVFVGEGSLRPSLERVARENPHIVVAPAADRAGVRAHLRNADVAVLASVPEGGRSEAAGLAPVEAQACGLPVVVTRTGGAPEMIVPGKTGLLVEPGDAVRLAAAFAELLEMRPDERRTMGRRGREFVVAHRSSRAAAQQLREIYAEL